MKFLANKFSSTEKVRLRYVQHAVRDQQQSPTAHAIAHWNQAIRVQPLQQGLRAEQRSDEAHANTRRTERLPVRHRRLHGSFREVLRAQKPQNFALQ